MKKVVNIWKVFQSSLLLTSPGNSSFSVADGGKSAAVYNGLTAIPSSVYHVKWSGSKAKTNANKSVGFMQVPPLHTVRCYT